jgi:hypothetical protein
MFWRTCRAALVATTAVETFAGATTVLGGTLQTGSVSANDAAHYRFNGNRTTPAETPIMAHW